MWLLLDVLNIYIYAFKKIKFLPNVLDISQKFIMIYLKFLIWIKKKLKLRKSLKSYNW